MPNAYKRQLKDKNQDYIYPVLDPADIPDVSIYLPKSGGQMTGNLTWKDGTALPQFSSTPPYFLGMESFANGATTKCASWDTVKNGILSNGSITTARLADKAVTPAKFDYSTKPTWSTFVIQQGADNTAGIDYTTLRGTAIKISRRSGGTWCSVVSGGANINVVKQTITARFSSTITGAFGAGNIKTGSKVYSYWAGASNGAYENKGVYYTAGSSDDFADAMITVGNKNATSIALTATRMNTTLWIIHAEIQSSGSATSIFLNTEVTTADANHIPTLYQRSATSSNTSFCRNVIEVLEE